MNQYTVTIITSKILSKDSQFIDALFEIEGLTSVSVTRESENGEKPRRRKAANPAKKAEVKDRRNKVLDLAKAGCTNSEMAIELGVSRGTVYADVRVLRAAGNDI